jgi:predicted kinase
VGIPGSGKSTWAREQLNALPSEYGHWVSRDMIRFGLVKEDEEYFSKEKEVFNLFVRAVQADIDSNFVTDIYADATHINEASREKLLGRLKNLENVNLNAVVFDISLETCLERNAQRTGRAYVPETAIRNIYNNFSHPYFDARKYDKIIEIGESF